MAKKRKKFVYRANVEARTRQMEQRRAEWKAERKWNEFIYRAYKGEATGLCTYLRSDLPLRADKREALADFIVKSGT